MKNTKRNRKGGMNSASPSSYSDAASYALATAGNLNTQYNNVFDIGINNQRGNGLIGIQGQTVGGGRSRRRKNKSKNKSKSRRKSQKGGLWGGIISTALAPFTLLAMQQSFRRKKGGRK